MLKLPGGHRSGKHGRHVKVRVQRVQRVQTGGAGLPRIDVAGGVVVCKGRKGWCSPPGCGFWVVSSRNGMGTGF